MVGAGQKSVLRAAWVAPMAGPLIRDGAIAFESGAILHLGPRGSIGEQHPDAMVIDRPGAIVLPGLINAHTHLELSAFSCGSAPASFVDWLKELVPRRQLTSDMVRASVTQGVEIGIAQCLRFGVTCVGDISRHSSITRPMLARGPLRIVSFGEVQAMAQRRARLEERIEIAADDEFASPWLQIGLSPHAPYSVEREGYRRCLEVARSRELPLATHLAETTHEAQFLADHTGPFRDLWEYLQAWDENVPAFEGGPIRMANALGLLAYPTILAHVNYCDNAELRILARQAASVAWCPRTHAFFGHPPHRWQEMLACGINVAVGTDSCASSPDLNLVDELRLLYRSNPNLAPARLWELITSRAARALGLQQTLGTLAPGKHADFVLFDAPGGDNPLARLLEADCLPSELWIAGQMKNK